MSITINTRPRAHAYMSIFGLLLMESRPVVLTLAGMRFTAGVLISTGTELTFGVVVAGLAWILVTAGIYLTNASSDHVADTFNQKRRPLAQGLLSRRQVNAGAVWAFIIALALGSTVGPAFLATLTSMGAIGIYYSFGSKPGKNHFLTTALIVAVGIFLPYIAGSLAAHGEIRQTPLLCGIACGSWAAVASISKDFPDALGDKATGRLTLPVALGFRKAWTITAGGSATVALISISCISIPGLQALWILTTGAFLYTSSCITLLRRRNTSLSLRVPYRIFMMTQLSTNTALIVTAPAFTFVAS